MTRNSPLVTYTKLSPNHSGKRRSEIDTITIHCIVGHLTVRTLGDIFAAPSRGASSNYGVDDWGGVGLYVDEDNRSWCSSSAANDHRAITIEVACDAFHPYAVSNEAYKTLIDLVVDICKRRYIKELKWEGDKTLIGNIQKQNMTVHRWFTDTACPGDWLFNKMGDIAGDVNKLLQPALSIPPSKPDTVLQRGDTVKIQPGATYYNTATKVPGWVTDKPWIVQEVNGNRVVVNQSVDGLSNINSPIHLRYLTKVIDTFKEYTVNINIDDLHIRSGAGVNYNVVGKTGKGIFTIVEESQGWGKLKSGVGWVSLDMSDRPKVDKEIKTGDLVDFKGGYFFANSRGGNHYVGKPGKATVTLIAKGAPYPYHVIRVGTESNVYGWVKESLIQT